MFQHVADQQGSEVPATGAPGPDRSQADFSVARFRSLSTEIRGCAILGPTGILAASGDLAAWGTAAAGLLEAADAAAGGAASQTHVATEEGEAYAVRLEGLGMVAVTDRFTLASLVLADMRAALRGLSRANPHVVREAA